MAPPKFGATKFRNAVPGVPGREEWYRTHLTGTEAAPPNTSAFSSTLKTTRAGVVTLTPAGDASVRSYAAVGNNEGDVWAGKLGAVADWDVSRLEDGGMVVAGTDGKATYYALTGTAAPQPKASFTLEGKASSIALHPTTPGLALAAANTVAIYDVAASSAAITLEVPGGAQLWGAAWSDDGRMAGGVSKKGGAYLWDPRAGAAPVTQRELSTVLQALKPLHCAFVGQDLFVTSFSKTRTRQYSLFSGSDLGTVFTAPVDTSQGPLIPAVDPERRIVYAAARGDMTLRQIELQGPQGYQEMPHALPAPLTAGGVALAHWSTLPVMEARIATVLVPTTDKDGDAILPVHINVPRRQLIDYHADLYPDVAGSVPEQTAQEWLKGGDKAPLPANLDPERRSTWEKSVVEGKDKWAAGGASGAAASAGATSDTPKAAPETPAPAATSGVSSTATTAAKAVPAETEKPASSDLKVAPAPAAPEPSSAPAAPAAPAATSLPTPQDGETYASTPYKVRIISDRLAAFQKEHVARGEKGPLMVGLQGPQGCGKTTLCNALLADLKDRGLRAAVLSLDDLYRTHEGLEKLAADHPENPLLSGRGPPGTHDADLASLILEQVQHINDGPEAGHVELPVFDKSLCDGAGDRSEETVPVDGPLDVFVLEGWSFGFGALTAPELDARLQAKDGKYFPQHTAQSLQELNNYLAGFAAWVYPFFEVLVQVEPDTYEHVFRWRLQQEHEMKKANGGRGMSDDQVRAFVERYMPSYELWASGVLSPHVPWAGRVLRLRYGADRELVAIEEPKPTQREETKKEPTATSASNGKPPAASTTSAAGTSVATATDKAPLTESTPSASKPVDAPKTPSDAKSVPTEPPAKAASSAPTTAPPASKTQTPPGAPYNPGWSRKYLAGKTPLNATYDHVPSLQTLHQDSHILRLTPHLALFPVQGPGGRLNVHPLSRKGRMPEGGVGFVAGGVPLADFAADPFSDTIVCAGEDGVLRVWRLSADGVEGAGPEPDSVVRGDHIDKIAQIGFHPTAKDLVLAITNELGAAHLRFFDLGAGTEAKALKLDAKGATGFAVSAKGNRVAVATKDARVLVVDPHTGASLEGNTHDSPRSAQLAWVGDDHLVSLGFGRGSMRQLHLYAVTDNEVKRVAAISLDVSPSVLFPHYDEDTGILYAWGKGQQNIQAFYIDPTASEPMQALPSFTAGTPQLAVAFLPKTACDVRKVEVAKCLRLTARSLEEVTFSIPRNRPQFFQDDVFVPTLDTSEPTTTAAAWLDGDKTQPTYIDLCPDGMEPLSKAPPLETKVKHKFVPAANVMSEEEKKKQEMDDLFAKAKALESSDEEDEPKRGGIPAPDDDDW